jgi:hypothetical protein
MGTQWEVDGIWMDKVGIDLTITPKNARFGFSKLFMFKE